MLATIEWDALIVDPVREMLTKIMAYLPVLLGALVILIVGWLIAKAIKRIVDWLLTTIRFDTLADKAGISEVLRKGNLKTTASQVLSGLVYWLIMIMVLVIVVNALGLPKASDILASLFAYVPKVIGALFVLVVAMFLANFVSGIVRTAAGNANLPKPEMFAGNKPLGDYHFCGHNFTGRTGYRDASGNDHVQYHPWRCCALPWRWPLDWAVRMPRQSILRN